MTDTKMKKLEAVAEAAKEVNDYLGEVEYMGFECQKRSDALSKALSALEEQKEES